MNQESERVYIDPEDLVIVGETKPPETDAEALLECLTVLKRILRDDLLIGAGSQCLISENFVERPLYGCVLRAVKHAESRLDSKNAQS
jgi:hypothetical protein